MKRAKQKLTPTSSQCISCNNNLLSLALAFVMLEEVQKAIEAMTRICLDSSLITGL